MYIRKTKDIYKILTNYGYGWEEEDEADTREEARRLAIEYKATACRPAVRIKKTREKLQGAI